MSRVCLDSNVLVAAFATRGLCAEVLRVVLSDYDLMVPEVVLEEVRRVLREKFRLSDAALGSVDAVFERCELVPRGTEPSPVAVRDADDERVLADAVSGGAQLLVTGDADLLSVAAESPIPILSPRAFLTLARGTF